MNKKKIIGSAMFAVIGLAIGYGIFGKYAGNYVELDTLFSFGGNSFQSAFRTASGIENMRNKILLCGLAGAVVGWLVSAKLKK